MPTESASDRVIRAASEVGVEVTMHTYPEGTRTAQDAADAIGCHVAAIAKTIVLHDDTGPLIVFTSGANRVDYDKVEAALGDGTVRRASADEARNATGYAIGGTAPYGHPSPLRMLMDADLMSHDQVWAAGGTPQTVFPIAPQRLSETTGAVVAEVAEVAEIS